jgi:hypothetical protein
LQHNKLKELYNAEQEKFEELCYQVFIVSQQGQELWQQLKERYLLQNKIDPSNPNAHKIAIFDAGFREAILGLYRFAQNHEAKQKIGIVQNGHTTRRHMVL